MGAARTGRRWPLLLAVAVSSAAVLASGCGGGGGDGGTGRPGAGPGDETIRSVVLVTEGADFDRTVDATLSPDGATVYFTATGAAGPGVFRLPAAGGPAVPVARGAPFRGPVGIATDGARLYVADPEFGPSGGPAGAILAVPAGGGDPAPVPGTEGRVPRGLEVVREGGAEVVYFTGRDPADGAPGIFKVAAAGAAQPTVVARGSPLTSPDAVTVSRAGVVYASDRGPGDGGRGAVFRIHEGSATRIADLRPPVLAGLALTLDESRLLVSNLSEKGTDEVLLVDVASGRTGTFSRVIGENRAGGGLHRARDVNVFAWADVQRPGRVYVLQP